MIKVIDKSEKDAHTEAKEVKYKLNHMGSGLTVKKSVLQSVGDIHRLCALCPLCKSDNSAGHITMGYTSNSSVFVYYLFSADTNKVSEMYFSFKKSLIVSCMKNNWPGEPAVLHDVLNVV